MGEFEYRGMGPDDVAVSGRISAGSHEQAKWLLDRMQIRAVDVRAVAVSPAKARAVIGHDDFLMINEQIVAMVRAGVPLEEGFRSMADDLAKPGVRAVISAVAEDLASGMSLDAAIGKRQGSFPAMYAQVLAVGAKTGHLVGVLTGFTRYLEFVGNTRRLIWDAMSYPAVVVLFMMIISWFLSHYTVPTFKEIFQDFGTDLPAPTKMIVAVAPYVDWLYPLIVAGVIAALMMLAMLRGPRARRVKESISLALPWWGAMVRECLTARFTQGLSVLVRAGLPLNEAIAMAGEATGSAAVQSDTRRVCQTLLRGGSVAEGLAVSRVLPRFLGQTLAVAADRQQLPECLEELSELYDQRANHSMNTLRSVMCPVLVVMLGVTVGGFVVAMFLPLVKLIGSVSGG